MQPKVVFMSDESLIHNMTYYTIVPLLNEQCTWKSFKSKHLSDESLPLKRASNLWQQFDGNTNHRWVGQKNNEVIFLFGRTKKTVKVLLCQVQLQDWSDVLLPQESSWWAKGGGGGGDFEEGVPTLVMLPALAFEVQLKTRARHRCRHPSCRCCCCSCSDVINRLRRETLFPGLVIKRHFLWQIHSNRLKTNLWFIRRRHLARNVE